MLVLTTIGLNATIGIPVNFKEFTIQGISSWIVLDVHMVKGHQGRTLESIPCMTIEYLPLWCEVRVAGGLRKCVVGRWVLIWMF